MIDLKHCTFLIPTFIDTNDRLQNILLVVKYLTTHFKTNILIGEQNNLKCVMEEHLEKHNLNRQGVKCFKFNFGELSYFNRQGIFNGLATLSNTNCISLYDTDVLVAPNQYYMACKQIMDGQYDMVYPYDGKFYGVDKQYRLKVFDSLNLDEIDLSVCSVLNPNSLGGAVIYERNAFIKGGMENENFKGWGHEDFERYTRFQKLGFRQCRVSGPLYHFTHETVASTFYIPNSDRINTVEYFRICNLSNEQLVEEVSKWSWCQNVK